MKLISILFFLLVAIFSNAQVPLKEIQGASDIARALLNVGNIRPMSPSYYVNPFIGTGGHGHTFPGATSPFGMVQLSPDTRYEGWDGCGGYHYSDSVIHGFSHTHLSGTGIPDYADLLVVPQLGKLNTIPGYLNSGGYGMPFSHKNEIAQAGYYSVVSNDSKIKVELTSTERCGIHRYNFIGKGKRYIILDLDYRDKVLDAGFNQLDSKRIDGFRISESWASEQHFYFSLNSSVSIQKVEKIEKDGQHKLVLFFEDDLKELILKVGVSAVSSDGAYLNFQKEANTTNFDALRLQNQKVWDQELQKIQVEDDNVDLKTIFYTALYHTMVVPNIFSDVDGQYRGRDLKIHKIDGLPQYTVFSLWDTYRSTHPLYTLIDQKRTLAFIQTFLRQYDEGGDLPVWELAGNETECMIGFHSVSVIADAYLKGIRGFDAEKALEAMIKTSEANEFSKPLFNSYGLLSADWESESVSKVLEYAYDHWCISEMAKSLGKEDIASKYLKSSFNFINHFDPDQSFMRARRGGQWFSPFDPSEVNFNYTEANSWQYSLYAPHHPKTLTNLFNGKSGLETWMDRLFNTSSQLNGREQADITGLIGQYAHGNEPSHHMAYLYNYTNNPGKTQFYVDSIQGTLYQNKPDGLSGNEDCGQMSSWYVMSALGFYPMAPGSNKYEVGHPIFKKVSINLENGQKLYISSNVSKANKYISSLTLNDKSQGLQIDHLELMKGGSLIFNMSPISEVLLDKTVNFYAPEIPNEFVPIPFIKTGERIFEDSLKIEMGLPELHNQKTYIIQYSIDNKRSWTTYKTPFYIKKTGDIFIKTIFRKTNYESQNIELESASVASQFILKNKNERLILNTAYAPSYSASGPFTLIDKIRGNSDFRTGDWQGFYGNDVHAVVEFEQPVSLTQVGISYIRDLKSWIFDPSEVIIELSKDGSTFGAPLKLSTALVDQKTPTKANKELLIPVSESNVKAIRYQIKNHGVCPEWHLGNGFDSWIFLDELIFY